METEKFNVNDYEFLHNIIPPVVSSEFISLLKDSKPEIKGLTERSVRNIIAEGAQIIIVLHAGSSSIAAVGIFLPIKHATGSYHEKRFALTHGSFGSISKNLLQAIDVVAREKILQQTRSPSIKITESEQWDQFFTKEEVIA